MQLSCIKSVIVADTEIAEETHRPTVADDEVGEGD